MKIIGKIINFLLTVWVSISCIFRTNESIILLLFSILIVSDVVTHNIWHLFPVNEIYWYKDKWRVCDIAYSIGKSFCWWQAYILIAVLLFHIGKIKNSFVIWIAELLSIGIIVAATTDLMDECTGGKTKDSIIEWLAFIITFAVIGFKIYKRIKNEQRT